MFQNQEMLGKALSLLPQLHEEQVSVVQTVSVARDVNGKVVVNQEEDYENMALKKGDKVCLDFGNHLVGYFSADLGSVGSHADAPVWMRVHFAENPAELLEDVGTYQGWICSSWIETEQLHVDVVPSVLSMERRYAFRYVQIEILDISSKFILTIKNARCRAVSSVREQDLKPYVTADPLKDKLDKIACRTLHNCMQTVFEDGPKRDRRLWMGDLRLQALANYQTYEKNELVKACLYLFAALPGANGQVGACLFLEPEPEVDDTFMFDYSLFFICALLDYYEATGDKETLQELWPTAVTQICIAEERLDENDIITDSSELGWCFVDWNLLLNKQASAQGIFLYALKAAIRIAKALRDEKEEKRLTVLYKTCKEAAVRYLWDEEKHCYISGADRQISVASQVWMVLGGAVEGKEAAQLLKDISHREGVLEMVTPYMYHHYIDALIGLGEKQLALECLEEYWGGMAEQGADTFWELFNPKNPSESPYGGTIVNSYCHAWSCAPAYFLRRYYQDGKGME
ncbi:MAG: GH116 family glycosyl hydrolase [Acetatifactor muris]|nr:GH116 family glycosyl hydrolase [Acetatifactor muris]